MNPGGGKRNKAPMMIPGQGGAPPFYGFMGQPLMMMNMAPAPPGYVQTNAPPPPPASAAPPPPPPPAQPVKVVSPLETYSMLSIGEGVPVVDPASIKAVHIYDFDNTLFKTPLPNPDLWSTSAISILESLHGLHKGGWWSDPRFLRGTGDGYETERARAWDGWWNDEVVQLARLSIREENTLTVVLSGRRYGQFSTIIPDMLAAKGLHVHGAIMRREENSNKDDSTLQFKNRVITDIIHYFQNAVSLTIYEDRPKQAAGFRKIVKRWAEKFRPELFFDVIEVYEPHKYLNPLRERDLIVAALEEHNQASERGELEADIRYSKVKLFRDRGVAGYLLDRPSRARVLSLLSKFPNTPGSTKPAAPVNGNNNYRYEGDVISVNSRGPLPEELLAEVGPVGTVVKWKATHVGKVDGKIWAAKVEPLDPIANPRTEHKFPLVVLVMKRKTNPTEVDHIKDWAPLREPVELTTRIGEKTQLRMNTVPRGKAD
ncbi:hypothetical protein TRVA0_008S02696 [Trichomonascus vanleenenianus]|uniref:uncharacterized protein n=1 Tax=Trichomonascus vanleenenianus TaxID=2268995 RepID=UPI003ECA363B